MRYPGLYKLSQDRSAFSVRVFWVWIVQSVGHSIILFFMSMAMWNMGELGYCNYMEYGMLFMQICRRWLGQWKSGRLVGDGKLNLYICRYCRQSQIGTWSWYVDLGSFYNPGGIKRHDNHFSQYMLQSMRQYSPGSCLFWFTHGFGCSSLLVRLLISQSIN